MRTHGLRSAAIVLAASATLSITVPIAIVHADSATTCTGPTQIFAALPDGSTRIYGHTDPVGGASTLTGPTVVGGPNGGVLLGGPDGDVYNIQHNGEFRRYHWNGTGWDPYVVIGQNWTGWDSPSVRNRITVDSLGNIYEIPNDGGLYVAHYDTAAGKIVEHEIDTNWGNYDLILAAGPGVLYARDPGLNGGQLYRYQYDANSQRWLQRQKVLSNGWNIFSGMFSPGGDTLYGHTVDSRGDLLWYHYTDATGAWAGGNDLGWGWDPSWLITSTSNTCSTPMTLPGKPHVAPVSQAAATLLANANPAGRLEYYYVGKDGSVVACDQTNVVDDHTAQYATLPGYSGSTGRVAAALNDNGGAQVFALGGDGEIRGSAQAAIGGAWPTLTPAGGYFPTEPTIVRKPDNTLVAFGFDDQGNLWYRPQVGKNGELTAWQSLGSTSMKSTLTAVVQSGVIRLFALDASGRLNTATLAGTTLTSWTQLTGLVGSTLPSVVIRTDGTAQVFALNDSDKSVRAIRQNADGTWPTMWTTTPNLTAGGAPSAALTAGNSVEVAVKGSDGYIYRTGPIAPGNPAFRDWSVLDPTDKAGSDPSTVLLTNGIWVVVFRDTDDNPVLFHTILSGSPTNTAVPPLVGGPVPVPRR